MAIATGHNCDGVRRCHLCRSIHCDFFGCIVAIIDNSEVCKSLVRNRRGEKFVDPQQTTSEFKVLISKTITLLPYYLIMCKEI